MNTFSERPGAEQRKNSMRRVDFSKHPIHALACVDDAVVSRRFFVNTLSCEYLSLVQYHRVTPELRRKLPGGTAGRAISSVFVARRQQSHLVPSQHALRRDPRYGLAPPTRRRIVSIRGPTVFPPQVTIGLYRRRRRCRGWKSAPPPQIAPEFIFTELPVCIHRVK